MAKTLGEQLEALEKSIERSEIALENSTGADNMAKRESLRVLYAERRQLTRDIERKGADYSVVQAKLKSPRRAYVRFS